MSEKKIVNGIKGAATAASAAATIIQLAEPVIDYLDKRIEERKKLATVPELYLKEYPLTVEQAVEILNGCGLKATLVEIPKVAARIQYRTYFDTQVVKTEPRAKQKVEPGTYIKIKYITQEVINESQRLYEESERQKAEKACEKLENQTKRKEKTRQVMSDFMDTAKKGIEKVPTVFHKKNNVEEEQDE